jgi:hypothetical protein
VRNSAFLDKFYSTNFLYDDSFLGEQVNNTLKHLPNDKIRAPYVWTVYNPVESVGKGGSPTSPNADKGFLYPSESVLNFDKATGVVGAGIKDNKWWRCHSEINGDFCSKYSFTNPSPATDAPAYRFPIFKTVTAGTLNAGGKDPGAVAAKFLDCSLWSVCIFIRIRMPKGDKQLGINYHYKPASYYLKAGKTAPGTKNEMNIEDYDIVYGAEQRGTQNTASPKIVTQKSVGGDRHWIRELDGDPVITYIEGAVGKLHACSKRGLCDYDTGKCECFFGYMGNACHVRTPSEQQGL